jgi:hypothetical protein
LTPYQNAVAANPAGNFAVSTASAKALAANPNRIEAIFSNDSDALIYLGLGAPAVYGKGVRLNSGESKIVGSFLGDIYAITGGFAGAATPVQDAVSGTSVVGSSPGTTLSWNHTVAAGSNRLLIVKIAFRLGSNSATAVSALTYGGVPLTFLGQAKSAATNSVRVEYWYLVAPAVGTASVAVTWTGGPYGRVGSATSYTGCSQVTPLGAVASNFASTNHPSLVVAAAPGDLVVDAQANLDDYSATVGAGQTSIHTLASGSTSNDCRLSGSAEAGASSVTMDWTLSSAAQWAQVGAALKPVTVTKNLCVIEI